MVYCAYQVELKREKLSIMVNMMADERTCTEGTVQIRDWQFGAWRNRRRILPGVIQIRVEFEPIMSEK